MWLDFLYFLVIQAVLQSWQDTWEDKAAYQASCKKLASSFVENFKKYTHMSDEVVAAGPKA